MARNADTQNNSSACRDNYENGYENSNGQNSSKNKASNKSSNKASNVSGTDKTGTDKYQQ